MTRHLEPPHSVPSSRAPQEQARQTMTTSPFLPAPRVDVPARPPHARPTDLTGPIEASQRLQRALGVAASGRSEAFQQPRQRWHPRPMMPLLPPMALEPSTAMAGSSPHLKLTPRPLRRTPSPLSSQQSSRSSPSYSSSPSSVGGAEASSRFSSYHGRVFPGSQTSTPASSQGDSQSPSAPSRPSACSRPRKTEVPLDMDGLFLSARHALLASLDASPTERLRFPTAALRRHRRWTSDEALVMRRGYVLVPVYAFHAVEDRDLDLDDAPAAQHLGCLPSIPNARATALLEHKLRIAAAATSTKQLPPVRSILGRKASNRTSGPLPASSAAASQASSVRFWPYACRSGHAGLTKSTAASGSLAC